MEQTVAILIAAHVLGDFLLQPEWLVKRKKQLRFMLLHGVIHAGLVYVLYQAWMCWELPRIILALHVPIDLIKQQCKSDSAKAFTWDQAAHILGLIGVGWLLLGMGWLQTFSGCGYAWVIGFAGFIATVQGAGYFIGKVAETGGICADRYAAELFTRHSRRHRHPLGHETVKGARINTELGNVPTTEQSSAVQRGGAPGKDDAVPPGYKQTEVGVIPYVDELIESLEKKVNGHLEKMGLAV